MSDQVQRDRKVVREDIGPLRPGSGLAICPCGDLITLAKLFGDILYDVIETIYPASRERDEVLSALHDLEKFDNRLHRDNFVLSSILRRLSDAADELYPGRAVVGPGYGIHCIAYDAVDTLTLFWRKHNGSGAR